MTYRFLKTFHEESDTLCISDVQTDEIYVTFELQKLRDVALATSEFDVAVAVARMLEDALGFKPTPEEIEYAVEDI